MSHSSCVRRKALRSAANCVASVGLPCPGQPAGEKQSGVAHSVSVQQFCELGERTTLPEPSPSAALLAYQDSALRK